MGSSAKKKKEKKADFQKQKLKVGKARPKAQNSTNTDFRAKAIVLNQQISSEAPECATQLQHHVSLLGSKTESQRKDSLGWLTSALVSQNLASRRLQISTAVLLEKAVPLILDASVSTRAQLEKLLKALNSQDLADHVQQILPYVRASLTHLSAQIRGTGLEVLSHLLSQNQVGTELVSSPGGWTKTLDCLVTLLGWRELSIAKPWSLAKANFRADAKVVARILQVLEQLLDTGLLEHTKNSMDNGGSIQSVLYDCENHQLSNKSNVYGYLHLFGQPVDLDEVMLEDREERYRVFQDRFESAFQLGVDGARKEGGDIGRIAGSLNKLLTTVSNIGE